MLPTFDVPPPKIVKDINGQEIELPRALGIGGAEACVAEWRQLGKRNLHSGNRQRPYSTHREDTMSLKLLLGNRNLAQLWSKGTFIEVGAFDGVTESNSQLFERCLNWTGILIEPNPTAWKALSNQNSRVHSHLFHASPTCNEKGTTVKMQANAFTSTTILAPDSPIVNPGVDVECTSMKTILAEAGASHVDFWSLDVEGSEALILQTVPFREVDFGLLVVESENRQCKAECPKRELVRELLWNASYVRKDAHILKSDVFQPASAKRPFRLRDPDMRTPFEHRGLYVQRGR